MANSRIDMGRVFVVAGTKKKGDVKDGSYRIYYGLYPWDVSSMER